VHDFSGGRKGKTWKKTSSPKGWVGRRNAGVGVKTSHLLERGGVKKKKLGYGKENRRGFVQF